jgi:hypothetical protein
MGELRTVRELRMREEDAFIFSKPKRRHLSTDLQLDVIVTWDDTHTSTVEIATNIFQKYIKKGWLAYQVTPEGQEIQIFKFNSTLEKIILVPLEGGG